MENLKIKYQEEGAEIVSNMTIEGMSIAEIFGLFLDEEKEKIIRETISELKRVGIIGVGSTKKFFFTKKGHTLAEEEERKADGLQEEKKHISEILDEVCAGMMAKERGIPFGEALNIWKDQSAERERRFKKAKKRLQGMEDLDGALSNCVIGDYRKNKKIVDKFKK